MKTLLLTGATAVLLTAANLAPVMVQGRGALRVDGVLKS